MTETEQETTPTTEQRNRRKVRLATVVSDRMDKTVVVQVTDRKAHRLYKKVIQHRTRFKAHDEGNDCKVGDLVRIMETRPLSKDKHWRVVEVVEKAR
jgi:small subunit ribosomal protein S17